MGLPGRRLSRVLAAIGLMVMITAASPAAATVPELESNPLCGIWYEEPDGDWVRFCDDPIGGLRWIVGNMQQFCEEGNCKPQTIRCLVLTILGQECI